MNKILLIEDDDVTSLTVQRALADIGEVHRSATANGVNQLLEANSYGLFILDIGLPDGDGISLCHRLSDLGRLDNASALFLTSSAALSDKLAGFDAGGDDYLVKPFSIDELRARVKVHLRKVRGSNQIKRLGQFEIDTVDHKVFITKDDKSRELIETTPIEFRIISALSRSPYEAIHRDVLVKQVWGPSVHLCDRALDVHISNLRRKVGVKGVLVSNRKKGYQLFSGLETKSS